MATKMKLTCDATVDPGSEDDSLVAVPNSVITDNGYVPGDTILIKGKKGKDTLAILVGDDSVEADKIRMSSVTRRNLGLNLGDSCMVSPPASEVNFATTVKVLPYDDSIKGITGNIYDVFVKPYFMDAYRPVKRGDRFMSRRAMKSVEFKIVEVEPGPYAIVGPDTLVDCKGDPLKRRDESKLSDVGYDDVGGVSKQLSLIRETVELPLNHSKLFSTLGVPMPRGVLIYGPPGSGKTLLARAVANETGAYMVLINGPELMGMDKKEEELVKKFNEAQDNAPSIIFIDEIDSVAPRREGNTSEATKRMVQALLLQIDGLARTVDPVIVIGATSVPGAVDGSMRRFGRFDRELDLGIPDDEGRQEILKVHTRNMKLAPDVDLVQISKETHGFVGADISQLTMEAALQCIRESMGALNLDDDELDSEVLNSLAVNAEHFKFALKQTNPSSLREMVVQIPTTSWASIGGLEDVKMELQELVQYPVEHPEKFEQFGMEPSRGVLFYGPPGCGKTLMAKAVANECQANFISVKGPELLNAYFGESEANVRMVFERARAAAPCVLFFDELDSIAVARGSGGSSSTGAMDRVINQLLTEIDGVGAKKNVFVIGATNRPDIIDPALMRPGRLDQLMYIPMPDYGSRLAILKATFKKAKLSPKISLEYLAECLDGYTGADLSEICQHAAKIAIKQNITEELLKLKGKFDGTPIEIINTNHLEASVKSSRKSVGEEELAEYKSFANKMKAMQEEMSTAPGGGSMATFSFANAPPKK